MEWEQGIIGSRTCKYDKDYDENYHSIFIKRFGPIEEIDIGCSREGIYSQSNVPAPVSEHGASTGSRKAGSGKRRARTGKGKHKK